MSRGNFYYAMGWVGNSAGSWRSGEIGRFDDLRESLVTPLLLVAIGAIAQALSAFVDVSVLSSVLPIFGFTLGLIGVISLFSIPEKGTMYVGGWTFISVLLFAYNIIGIGEFLTDLIPLAILILYGIYKVHNP